MKTKTLLRNLTCVVPEAATRAFHRKTARRQQTWCRKISLTLFALALSATAGLAQNVNVNPGAGSYPTLKAAFDAINAGTHTGAVTVDIVGDTTEAASAVLNASGAGSAFYISIVISPSGGVVRTMTGSGLLAVPMIDLNGADNVTIDGLNTGGNGLTISNPSVTAGTSTIRFIADATNNTVQNCLIQGSGTSVTSGTIFFSTGTASGNDGNIINANTITSAGSNLPVNAIFSLGTSAAIDNSGISITANNISDYFSATLVSVGINLAATGNSAWTISNNKLFQTGTRIYTAPNTHSGIFVGTGSGYTINNNTIGFADATGAGTTNMEGVTSGALGGTFPSSYTVSTAVANLTLYRAINCAFTAAGAASNIQGNTIAGHALYTSSSSATAWVGILVSSGNANIGTTTKNIIGAEAGGGGASAASIYLATTATGGTVSGINATSVNTVNIQNNTIGSVDAVGTTATVSGGFQGIGSSGAAGVYTINSNFVGNGDADNIRTGYTLSAGSLSNNGTLTSTTGGTATFVGIQNSASGATLSINNNTLRGWAVGGTVTTVTGIINSGVVTTTVTNNLNALGTAARGWVRYAFANSGALAGIVRTTGPAAAATLSISNNDFQGIVNSVAGTHTHTYINWSHGNSVADNVDNNTFTNLSVNTNTSVTFLNRGTTSMTATGSLSISLNRIITGFTKASAGGTVTFYTNGGGASSPNGSTELENLNNFSNVTLTGATTVVCWSDSDGPGGGSGPTKTITNNTFNLISTGSTVQVTGISFNFSGNNTTVSNNTLTNWTGGLLLVIASGTSNSGTTGETISFNTISNLTAAGQINAIQTGAGTPIAVGNINNNTITNLSSVSATANPIFTIIASGFGTTTNISKNKIGNIQSTGNALAGSVIFGILAQTAGTTYNITNNLVGDLRLPANPAANNLQGISIGTLTAGTTVNVSYNTVWLNETVNAVAGFGSSAVFASTTPTVVMRDNILVNRSVNNTTGLTVAYRRSSATLTTYGSASNNNDFYAGTPGTNNLIFNDTVNSDQTIAAYKARVTTRDSASFTENPTFLSTTARPAGVKSPASPTDANFLHIDPATPTHLESGAANITGITDDYDNDIRQGNIGYAGTGTAPDVGADEFGGTALAYNANLSNLVLSAGAITPPFAPNTTSYTLSVPNSTMSTTVTPTAADSTSTITVNGVPVASGIASGSITLAVGPNTITIVVTAQDGVTIKTYTVTVTRAPNNPPTITATGVTRQEGSPASNSPIATVNDTETGPGSVTVTVISANPSNGVTISNIVNSGGAVTADVVAACGATNASFTLQASDGNSTATDTLNVTVTTNAAPTLSYNNASVALNGSITVSPATGPSDNGSISTIAVQSPGTYTGTISVDNGTGVVSISNAAPLGAHTITIRATDNCGTTTDATFTLTVAPPPSIVYVDDSWTAVPNGQDPDAGGPATSMGFDAFATIQGGVTAVTDPGTVIVYAGTYAESNNAIHIAKSLTISGPNAAISPNGVAPRTAEAVITSQGTDLSPNSVFVVDGANRTVIVEGFKFDGTPSAMNAYSPNDNITLQKNILTATHDPGMYFETPNLTINDNRFADILVQGEDTIQVGRNVGVARVPVSITDNVWTNVSTAGANLDTVTGTISGNTFQNIVYYGFLIVHDSGDLTISDNLFDGITNPDPVNVPTWGAGVRFYEPTVTAPVNITSNTFTNSYAGVGVRGVPNDPGADITGMPIHVNFNSFIGNTNGISDGAAGTLDAQNNWWGCNFGPGVGGTGCTGTANGVFNNGSGSVDANPWIVLGISASPNPITPGGTSTVTADMTHNSDNAVPSGTTFVPQVGVAFAATEGTMAPPTGTITNGQATSLFTSTSANDGTASATVNNQIVSTTIDVDAPSFSINDVTHLEGDVGTTSYVFTVTKTGSTALSSSVNFNTQDGSATLADNDYQFNSGPLTFGPSDTSMPITVLVNRDTTFEPNEAFTVLLSGASGATISDASGTGTINNDDPPPPVTVTPTGSPTVADNDYTRINNAVQAAFPAQTIKLVGTFNWTEPNAAASWALGSDGIVNTADDYSIMVPTGLSNVTFTADNLGDATIQGPGDLPTLDLESVFYFNGGPNQDWTISNIRFLDFDLAIGMFAGSTSAFNNTHIVNNYIRMARDVATAGDTAQNIAIYYSFGTNQLISGNTIDIQGDGVSVTGNNAADIGMQCDTSGGNVYNGLQITNNTIHVLNAQSANPEVIIGIWENAHGHSSNITVSGNSFTNLALGNNPATNLQRGFRLTSHSSGSSTVTYANNTVNGANLGFQWIAGSAFAGNLPIQLTGNTLTGNGTGMLVQSQGQAHLTDNTITGNGAGSIGVKAIDGLTTVDVTKTTISGAGNAVVVDATGSGTDPITMRITNSTLSGNTAASGGALSSVGTGGTARTTITNSTVTENSPSGASILLQDSSLTVGNSIFNTSAPGTNISALGASPVTSLGYNLSRDAFGGFLANTGDQLNTDPMLGPLKNNGGPTFTHAPLDGSTALDKGRDIGPVSPTYAATGQDQRSSTRPVTYDASIVPPAGGDRSDIGAVELDPGVKPQSAASWLLHGAAGFFPVNLPLSGPVGIECRTGATSGEYQVIVTFAQPITFSSADVTSGTGSVSGTSISKAPAGTLGGPSGTQVTIDLTGVTNAQTIVIALFDVDDGVNIGDVGVRMGMLLGDINGVAGVTASDVNTCKAQVGATLSPTNFRSDVNTTGQVTASDVNVVKAKVGTVLPP
jgi:hypothetical protein